MTENLDERCSARALIDLANKASKTPESKTAASVNKIINTCVGEILRRQRKIESRINAGDTMELQESLKTISQSTCFGENTPREEKERIKTRVTLYFSQLGYHVVMYPSIDGNGKDLFHVALTPIMG